MDQRGSLGRAGDHSKWPQYFGAGLYILSCSLVSVVAFNPMIVTGAVWLHWLVWVLKWVLIAVVTLLMVACSRLLRINSWGGGWLPLAMFCFHGLWLFLLIVYPKIVGRELGSPEGDGIKLEFFVASCFVHALAGGMRSFYDGGMTPIAMQSLKLRPVLRLFGPLELLYSVSFYSYERQVTVPLRHGIDGRTAGQQPGGTWKNGLAIAIGLLSLILSEILFFVWFIAGLVLGAQKYRKVAVVHSELVACLTDAKMISKSMVVNKVESYIMALGSGQFVDWNGHQVTNGWESDPADSGRITLYACLPGEPTGFRLIYDGPKSKVTWIREDDRGRLTWQFPWKEQPSDEVVCVWLEYLLCGVVSYKGRLYSDGWSGLGDGEKTDRGHVVYRYL